MNSGNKYYYYYLIDWNIYMNQLYRTIYKI